MAFGVLERLSYVWLGFFDERVFGVVGFDGVLVLFRVENLGGIWITRFGNLGGIRITRFGNLSGIWITWFDFDRLL